MEKISIPLLFPKPLQLFRIRENVTKLMVMMTMMNCFCGIVDWWKQFAPHFQPGSLSENLTIANLWGAASRVWIYAESETFWNSDFVEWSCAVVITTSPLRHMISLHFHLRPLFLAKVYNIFLLIKSCFLIL